MNILCATDSNYATYCCIMLESLFESNSDSKFKVFLLTNDLSENAEALLKNTINSSNNEIVIIRVSEESLTDCPIRINDYVSIVTYFRILAPQVLPNTVDKILYLDCDIVVCGDIKELYNTNIDSCGLAGVTDEDYLGDSHYIRLNYPKKLSYINAGVLLINLKYWRENDIMYQCLDYIKNNPEACLFHDQDAINYVLREKKIIVDVKYNFQTGYLYSNQKLEEPIKGDIYKTIDSKSYAIIHYTGKRKPWHNICYHPLKSYFEKIVEGANIKLCKYKEKGPKKSLPVKIKELAYNYLVKIGLKKPYHTYIIVNGKRCI